jgi:hypothetical protein
MFIFNCRLLDVEFVFRLGIKNQIVKLLICILYKIQEDIKILCKHVLKPMILMYKKCMNGKILKDNKNKNNKNIKIFLMILMNNNKKLDKVYEHDFRILS